MYGYEAWTISKQLQKKLEATEMWFIQRMLQISRTVKKSNEMVLQEAEKTILFIYNIDKLQATFLAM